MVASEIEFRGHQAHTDASRFVAAESTEPLMQLSQGWLVGCSPRPVID